MKLDNLLETVAENQIVEQQKKMKKIFSHDLTTLPDDCPIRNVLANVFDKWSIMIFFSLGHHGILRFSALRKNIKGISAKVLSNSLKSLEEDGYISRTVYSEVPIRVEYQLTPLGISFLDKILELSVWINESMSTTIKKKYKIDEVLHQHPTSVLEK